MQNRIKSTQGFDSRDSQCYQAKTPRHIAVVMPSLAGGGMERMMLHLIDEWLANGFSVDLVVGRRSGSLIDLVPANVRVVEVAKRHNFLFPFGLYRYFRTSPPKGIIAGAMDINAVTLVLARLFVSGSPAIFTVHNHFSSQLRRASGFEWIKLCITIFTIRYLLKDQYRLVTVSCSVADDIARYLRPKGKSARVIHNPVITEYTWRKIHSSIDHYLVHDKTPYILFVGRLVPEKGLDVLFDAFASIATKTDTHLAILGDGLLREQLVAKSVEGKLEKRVHFLGFVQNPLAWMRAAKVVTLPSRHEGLPTVLIEALAAGAQIVATDCPGGSAEILGHGRWGQLVPVDDAKTLSDCLLNVLQGRFHIDPAILIERAAEFSATNSAQEYLATLFPDYKKPR